MNEISCELCMDLMPLVHDGVASRDSGQAVERHIQRCPECRAMFAGPLPQPVNQSRSLELLRRKLHGWLAMVLMFGLFLGLSLTAGSGLFLNILIMPAIGVLGYCLYRWRAVYTVPVLLLAVHTATNALGFGSERLDCRSLLMWTGIYCGFALVGTGIAGLFHFAFRKEDSHEPKDS